MTIHICCACGTSYASGTAAPEDCPICDDERQFVPVSGQAWTTPQALASSHTNAWRHHEPALFEIRSRPDFAIGQRAFLLQTPAGNVLWDCIALFDRATEEIVRGLGGLSAIAISHPHYYTTMQDWAGAFDVPILLHTRDREWVMRPDKRIDFWEGESHEIEKGLTLLRLGGHFPGGTVLHWSGGAEGRGALLSGDIVQVATGGRRVSFMWSYPNMMPLAAATIRRIQATLEPWMFECVYGAFSRRQITVRAKQVITRSASRYIELLDGDQA